MPRINIGEVELNVADVGEGPAIVFVHGFPLDHSMWQAQIDEFSSSHRVITPDLRGFGQSGIATGTVTMQQFADDVAALLDVMHVDQPVTFCGLSMGGYIGWQFFKRHRSKLARLIQCDTRAIADTPEGRKQRLKAADTTLEKGAGSLVETMLARLFAEELLFSEHAQNHQPDIVRATREVMLTTNPQSIAAAQRGMAERPDVTEMLGQIDVPTLILCGEHDAISPAEEMRGISAAIPGAQYVEIAGAGHMSPLEKPAEVNSAIQQFLAAE